MKHLSNILSFVAAIIVFGLIVYLVAVILPRQHIKDNEAAVVDCHQEGGQLEYVNESDTYNCLLPK